jgi:hypothetical protein
MLKTYKFRLYLDVDRKVTKGKTLWWISLINNKALVAGKEIGELYKDKKEKVRNQKLIAKEKYTYELNNEKNNIEVYLGKNKLSELGYIITCCGVKICVVSEVFNCYQLCSESGWRNKEMKNIALGE